MTPPERDFPWWLVALVGLGLWGLLSVWSDPLYREVAATLARGVRVTLFVAVTAFAMACALGLALALMAVSGSLVLRQASRLYVEVVRGVPILVLLLYVAFVGTPGIVAAVNWLREGVGLEPIRTRDFPLIWRAITALVVGYAAFVAEVFRAGLLSVDRGQVEAAKALGLRPAARFRHVIWPQAIRAVLPPLGNDFVAMVKDSSLVSVLGVLDVTQLGKLTAAANFRYLETYNVVAAIYLTLTVTLSVLLRRLEARLRSGVARAPEARRGRAPP